MTNRLEYLLEEYEQRQHNLSTTNSQTPTPSNLYGRKVHHIVPPYQYGTHNHIVPPYQYGSILSLHISMVDVANISMVDVGGFV